MLVTFSFTRNVCIWAARAGVHQVSSFYYVLCVMVFALRKWLLGLTNSVYLNKNTQISQLALKDLEKE